MLPQTLPRANELGLDAHVLLFILGASILTGIPFGVAPAWKISQTNLQETFKERGRGAIGGRSRLQRAFVVAELALALVLRAGAGLMLRTLSELSAVNRAFPHDAQCASIRLSLCDTTRLKPHEFAGPRGVEFMRALSWPGVLVWEQARARGVLCRSLIRPLLERRSVE